MNDQPALARTNPFQARATTSVEEGSFLESYQTWSRVTPTLDLPPVHRLVRLTTAYRSGFDDPESRDGQVAFVHGAHGAGKTHAVRASIGRVADAGGEQPMIALYVKLENPNFVDAYGRLMAQLTLPALRDLTLRFLGSLAPASQRVPSPPAARDLHARPDALLQMFDDHLLERGLVLEAQAEEMASAVGLGQSFQRALTYLLVPALEQAAYDWLLGRPVDAVNLRRLGIPGPIDSPRQCRYGLQLLTLICGRAGRPIVVVIDQCEKFLFDADDQLIPENVGLIHTLVERLPRDYGMLVLCANEDAWHALPDDLRQRFGANDVPCPALQPYEAVDLLDLYVRFTFGDRLPPGYKPPWPLTDAALRPLLRLSGGNIRTLLQLAWCAYDLRDSDDATVGPDLLERAMPTISERFDRVTVIRTLGRVLRRIGMVTAEPSPGFDLMLEHPFHGPLVIRVSNDAILSGDEASRAQTDAEALIGRAQSFPKGAAYVLVIIGYASSDVLDVLKRVYDEVLVYDHADTVTTRLRDLLIDSPAPRPDTAPQAPELEKVFEMLDQLRQQRDAELYAFQSQLGAITAAQQADSARRRFEELMIRWRAERERIAERIAKARRSRERDELDEFHRLAVEHENGRKLLLASAVTTFGLALAVTFLSLDIRSTTMNLVALIAGVAGVLAALTQRWIMPSGPAPRTLSEVRKRAQQQGDAMRSGNPYRRYAWSLCPPAVHDAELILDRLRTERSALIRRTLTEWLGEHPQTSFPVAAALMDQRLTELPYFLQHVPGLPGDVLDRLQPQQQLLLALNPGNAAPPPADRTAGLVAATAAGTGPLGAAYTGGLNVTAVHAVGDREVRRAIRLLSPFTDGGLGTFDHLRAADEIEHLYLFFEQLQYLRDGGVDLTDDVRE